MNQIEKTIWQTLGIGRHLEILEILLVRVLMQCNIMGLINLKMLEKCIIQASQYLIIAHLMEDIHFYFN